MRISVQDNRIIIDNPTHFNIKQILESGQVFRYQMLEDGSYQLISQDKVCILKDGKDRVEIITNHPKYFYNYFDLSTDYSKIIKTLNNKYGLSIITDYGQGIRILKQDKFETIISFIISANNNIPRIKGIIERLCNALGKDSEGNKAFPSVESIAEADYPLIESLGTGYRARYIHKTAKIIYGGFDLENLTGMDSVRAREQLLKLSGVGPKVADCILLFAYSKMDVFPVDTWIAKVYQDELGTMDSSKRMTEYLTNKYHNLSGFAQQYLFYYKRETKNNINR